MSLSRYSGAEQNLPRRSARPIPKKPRPCLELLDVLTYSHLRTLSLTLEGETGCGKAW